MGIILPHYGEFGWLVLNHARYVHGLPGSTVICDPSTRCLFPSASSFIDWVNPLPDAQRNGNFGLPFDLVERDTALLRASYPSALVPRYESPWITARTRVPLTAQSKQSYDIVFGVRNRSFASEKNWGWWDHLASCLSPLRVGYAGVDVGCQGSIDMLLGCRLYVGTDSGVSHLAALCHTPSIVFRNRLHDSMIGLMVLANSNSVYCLDDSAWDHPDMVLGAITRIYNKELPNGEPDSTTRLHTV